MANQRRVKTAILISGRGSNMVSLIKAAKAKDYPADISLVISNQPDAAGLEKARSLNVQAMALDHKAFTSRASFEKALDAILREAGIELICCAGFMRVLTADFVQGWRGRMLNIHPSLLPKYKGLHTHARALAAGDSEHGASIHWVSAELDGGKIIAQKRIKIKNNDTVDTLTARLLPIELTLYPQILGKVARQLRN